MSDLYEILGLPPGATPEDIRTAFRKLALEYHPDRTGQNPEATALFRHITEAYRILSDPAERSLYDRAMGHPTLPRDKPRIKINPETPGQCTLRIVTLLLGALPISVGLEFNWPGPDWLYFLFAWFLCLSVPAFLGRRGAAKYEIQLWEGEVIGYAIGLFIFNFLFSHAFEDNLYPQLVVRSASAGIVGAFVACGLWRFLHRYSVPVLTYLFSISIGAVIASFLTELLLQTSEIITEVSRLGTSSEPLSPLNTVSRLSMLACVIMAAVAIQVRKKADLNLP